jgi:hypothetical protein
MHAPFQMWTYVHRLLASAGWSARGPALPNIHQAIGARKPMRRSPDYHLHVADRVRLMGVAQPDGFIDEHPGLFPVIRKESLPDRLGGFAPPFGLLA